MRIRSVIVDDDDFVRTELEKVLSKEFKEDIEVIASFASPSVAIDHIKKNQPELLFLDIQMPEMSGFELVDVLPEKNFEVIFITSYNEYAIKAIKYSALDYLLKPIKTQELKEAIARYKDKTDTIKLQTRLSNLKENLLAKDESELQLVVSSKQGEHRFAVADIVRCEADSNYTHIYLTNQKKYLASKTLSDVEHMLSEAKFIRVHKSHLVNMSHVANLSHQIELTMKDNSRVPVSRRRVAEVRKLLLNK